MQAKTASAFLDEETSDVTLVVGDLRLPVHRFPLYTQSDYFRCLFSEHYEEGKKKEIEIKDVDPIGFELLLKFIYEMKVDLSQLTGEELFSLFPVTKQLLFMNLFEEVRDFVRQQFINQMAEGISFDLKLALKWYHLAIKQEEVELEIVIQEYLERNANFAVKDPDFLSSSFEVIEKLLSSDAFYAPELDIFAFIRKWLEVGVKEEDTERQMANGAQLKSNKVKAAYSLVRFHLITLADLCSEVFPVIKSLDLDLHQHLGKYRGVYNWKEESKKHSFGGNEIEYHGPPVGTISFFEGGISFAFEGHFPITYIMIQLKAETRVALKHLRISFYVGEDGDKINKEMHFIPSTIERVQILTLRSADSIVASKITIRGLKEPINISIRLEQKLPSSSEFPSLDMELNNFSSRHSIDRPNGSPSGGSRLQDSRLQTCLLSTASELKKPIRPLNSRFVQVQTHDSDSG